MNVFSILLYFFTFFIIIITSSCSVERGSLCLVLNEKKKSSISLIVLISFIVTLYNVYCTTNSTSISSRNGGDRFNYYVEFLGRRETSVGLTFVFDCVKKITENFYFVLYLTSFLCCVITLYSYRLIEEKSLPALIFLFFTDIVFTMFVNLKQCYANSFVSLAIALTLGERKLYKDLISVLCIIIALQFHAIAIVAFPVFLLIRFNSWQKNKFALVCIIVIALFLAIEPVSILLARLIRPIYPYGADKLLEYFKADTTHTDEGSIFSFIKGAPFYIVSIVGVIKRNELKERYSNYDNYLFLSLLGSLFYLASVASYWMYRATALFYLPISIFFGILYRELISKRKTIFALVVLIPHLIIFIRWIVLICINYGSI